MDMTKPIVAFLSFANAPKSEASFLSFDGYLESFAALIFSRIACIYPTSDDVVLELRALRNIFWGNTDPDMHFAGDRFEYRPGYRIA